MPEDVLILGASTRAAAFSAIRAGLRPRCADYFADRDLAAVCRVDRIDPREAKQQFITLAESVSPMPWFYTGGFENHPDWVEAISRRHRLWGVDSATLRAVRDPFRVADVLAHRGIPCPAVRRDSRDLPRDGSWLQKPLASGGGLGILPFLHPGESPESSHYFQERIAGNSFAALFLGDRSRAQLVGVTHQLLGSGGMPYVYRGSVGPVAVAASLGARLQSLGDALVAAFGLAGWFGVDYILRDQIPWPVEVNPRYTASIEIHELAAGRSLVPEHRQIFETGGTTGISPTRPNGQPTRIIAKAVLYAPRPFVASTIELAENQSADSRVMPSLADIPWPGTTFNVGDPVMTLYADGACLAECQSNLVYLTDEWKRHLNLDDERSDADRRQPLFPCQGDDDAPDI